MPDPCRNLGAYHARQPRDRGGLVRNGRHARSQRQLGIFRAVLGGNGVAVVYLFGYIRADKNGTAVLASKQPGVSAYNRHGTVVRAIRRLSRCAQQADCRIRAQRLHQFVRKYRHCAYSVVKVGRRLHKSRDHGVQLRIRYRLHGG